MPHTPLIALESVSFQSLQRSILENLSLSLLPNHFYTVIGPNGAGKTTLLKLMIGLLQPTAGHILRSPTLRIGYMPQKLLINRMMPLTVKFFLQSAPFFKECQHLIHKIGIQSLLKQSVHDLSGGEFQRVLLVRALMNKPNLLILDEPTQGVDIPGQYVFFNLLNDVRKEQDISVLMVSHDLNFVHHASDVVICLNKHICCTGKPEDVRKLQPYLDLFGPDQDLFGLYRHHHTATHDRCAQDETTP